MAVKKHKHLFNKIRIKMLGITQSTDGTDEMMATKIEILTTLHMKRNTSKSSKRIMVALVTVLRVML
jgi:hypothetical protein